MPEKWPFSPLRLRGHRERRGLSRLALAARVGVHLDSIKSYEYGLNKPSLDVFLSLAGSLDISPNDLCVQPGEPADKETQLMAGRCYPLPPPPPSMKPEVP